VDLATDGADRPAQFVADVERVLAAPTVLGLVVPGYQRFRTGEQTEGPRRAAGARAPGEPVERGFVIAGNAAWC
jgi:hypothetical protein